MSGLNEGERRLRFFRRVPPLEEWEKVVSSNYFEENSSGLIEWIDPYVEPPPVDVEVLVRTRILGLLVRVVRKDYRGRYFVLGERIKYKGRELSARYKCYITGWSPVEDEP